MSRYLLDLSPQDGLVLRCVDPLHKDDPAVAGQWEGPSVDLMDISHARVKHDGEHFAQAMESLARVIREATR